MRRGRRAPAPESQSQLGLYKDSKPSWTKKEIATAFCITTRRVNQLIQTGTIKFPDSPVEQTRAYITSIKIDIDRIRELRLQREQTRLEREKFELDIRRANFIPKELPKIWLGQLVGEIRGALLCFGSRMAPALIGLEVREMESRIDEECMKILNMLSQSKSGGDGNGLRA